MTDSIGRAKFDAWAELSGTTQETAMQDYVELISSLKDE
jgi:diazepam-binding inhibitor (GABA receptor modulator, acyl-CoA-binding protein)